MYTIIFISCDILSLILQAAAGAITSIADANSLRDTGVNNVMIAGLAFQVFSLALFIDLNSEFLLRVRRQPKQRTLRLVLCVEALNGNGSCVVGWSSPVYLPISDILAALMTATMTVFIWATF